MRTPTILFNLVLFFSLCTIFMTTAKAGTGYAGTDTFSKNKQSTHLSNFEKRKIYLNLIYLIKSNQRTKYRKALASKEAKIRDYPLYPYLEYTEKAHRISRQSEKSILSFITQYQDTPLAYQLRQKWLNNLAINGRWSTFLKHFDPAHTTSKNRCYQAYALYKNSKKEEALSLATDLWLVSYSQPDACDSIFKVWRDAGRLSQDLAWQRFALSMEANKISLANYLTRYLRKEDKSLASQYIQVHRSPRKVIQTKHFLKQNTKTSAIIIHGIKRLARKDPLASLNSFEKYQTKRAFDKNQIEDTYKTIAIRLARQSDLSHHLDRIPKKLRIDDEVIESLILMSLRKLDWPSVLTHFTQLSPTNKSTERWQYWQGRAISESLYFGEPKSKIFNSLARNRSYYGFLTADLLGQEYAYNNQAIDITHEEILSLEETPGIQRALELFTIGEKTLARREWRFTTTSFSDKEYQIAAQLAQKWGWYKQSIQSSINARSWDDLDIRFPIAYQHNFIIGARTSDIPLSWSLAVARQESAFMPDAKSSAGALGIMQVLPSTAKYVLKQKKTPTDIQLTNPATSIKIGSTYLGQLLRQFDNSRVLASSAYNAGPSRARAWRDDLLPLDVWIETIPFKETRNYVMNVMMFSNIYQHLLKQQTSLFSQQELKMTAKSPALLSKNGMAIDISANP